MMPTIMSRDPEHGSSVERVAIPELNAILGQPFPVLDDGFVRAIDYMGGDAAIVQAARVSYGAGTKRLSEDRALIRYLMRHAHTTPFQMCELKLHVRVPMDCWRQWIRHRTASVNEYSTRYSIAIDAASKTAAHDWRGQATTNRQGSGASLDSDVGEKLSTREAELHAFTRAVYDERIAVGVAREQARKDLPLSTYTEAYWKIDLHNLFHFLALRMDAHAQAEIRAYAAIIGKEIVARWCPVAWEAFCDYRLRALTVSKLEIELIARVVAGDIEGAIVLGSDNGLLQRTETGDLEPSRERREIEDKLHALGVPVPWQQRP